MYEESDIGYYRYPWNGFPDCIIHADERQVRGHHSYHAAKTGDSDAAFELVRTFLNDQCLTIGQGGTLANLRGWILHCGGRVGGATVLTGKSYSAKLAVESAQIDELEKKHGHELRGWWEDRFGFSFNSLTSSEARYLIRTPSADRIRDRIIAAVQK